MKRLGVDQMPVTLELILIAISAVGYLNETIFQIAE